jgi:hypothetical protein
MLTETFGFRWPSDWMFIDEFSIFGFMAFFIAKKIHPRKRHPARRKDF